MKTITKTTNSKQSTMASFTQQFVSEGNFLVSVCHIAQSYIETEDLIMTDFTSISLLCLVERRHGTHGVRAWLGTSSKRDLDDYCEFFRHSSVHVLLISY